MNWGRTIGQLGFTAAEGRSVKPMPKWVLDIVPKPDWKINTLKPGDPDVERDTIPAIKKIVADTLYQTAKLAAKLKGSTLEESTRNVWQFVYGHVKYVPDDEKQPIPEKRHEQLRTPSHTIHTAKGDCDCMVILISSLLMNMAIMHSLRIMKQHSRFDSWGHIYVVVKNGSSEIILDCVTDDYNYEAPHVQHKDFTMALQRLNGLQSLSGLGDCNNNATASGNGTAPKTETPNSKRYPVWERAEQFRQRELIITEHFLKANAIAFTVVDDETKFGYMVGKTFAPAVITADQAAHLMKPEVQNPPAPVTEPKAVKKNGKLLWLGLGVAAGVAAACALSSSKKAA